MSAKDKGGNPVKPQDEQKKTQEQKKLARNFQPYTQRKKDPEVIPVLCFSTNSNLFKFCEALSKKVLKGYGIFGKLIDKALTIKLQNPREQITIALILYCVYRWTQSHLEDMKEWRNEKVRI